MTVTQPDLVTDRPGAEAPEMHSASGGRVLVVDDDLELATLLQRGLQTAGYAVEVAPTGSEALRRIAENEYDAVLLDFVLPGMSGLEVCRRLRSRRYWVPILMLTGRDAVADRVAGLDVGADDYMIKPFSFDELTARIRALVRRGAVERPTELRVGDLRLDPISRRAWRGEVELDLSVKEFGVLQLFLSNPDIVLSRSEILEHVWDCTYEGASNVVDQYVLYLRRKIDRPFRVRQLETVRGAGYRLCDRPARV